MTFLRRLLSGDYRRALAAEAAGDYAEAARHYALSGERAKVAEMHLLRSERAAATAEKLDELRDALRWADAGTPGRARVLAALGRLLVRRARAEGAATARDAASLREAAAFLDEAGEHKEAGEALELLGDDEGAARCYERGGHLEEMEEALARERHRRRRDDRLRDGFARYQAALADGRRDAAVEELTGCCEAAEDKSEYRRLLDELRARLLTDGALALRRRPDGRRLHLAGGPEIKLGRDAISALPLRAAGVSRLHAQLRWDGAAFLVRDGGSRAGTFLAGLPLDGEVPLAGGGSLRLGEELELSFRATGPLLRLDVVRGLDRGAGLVCAAPGHAIDLAATELEVAARLTFHDGRPLLEAPGLALAGLKVVHPAQLLRGDVITIDAVELEVA